MGLDIEEGGTGSPKEVPERGPFSPVNCVLLHMCSAGAQGDQGGPEALRELKRVQEDSGSTGPSQGSLLQGSSTGNVVQ